jgi:hypothetical protein
LRSNVKEFRDEFEQHVREGACPFDGEHKEFAGARASGTGLGEAGIAPQPSAGVPVDEDDGS